MTDDTAPSDLRCFVDAQAPVFDAVLANSLAEVEARRGRGGFEWGTISPA